MGQSFTAAAKVLVVHETAKAVLETVGYCLWRWVGHPPRETGGAGATRAALGGLLLCGCLEQSAQQGLVVFDAVSVAL